mmetsp:Transcript_71988/g.134575  ORF Transcript_71988/g.134575 Transcript_71988/m.134575 type:complete len:114 (-) Transcript_71988:498-839(-)
MMGLGVGVLEGVAVGVRLSVGPGLGVRLALTVVDGVGLLLGEAEGEAGMGPKVRTKSRVQSRLSVTSTKSCTAPTLVKSHTPVKLLYSRKMSLKSSPLGTVKVPEQKSVVLPE